VAPFTFHGYNGKVRGVVALAVALGAVFVASAVAAPRPHVERAQSGDVQAVFTYTWDPARFRFGKQRLTIKRLGETRFAARLRPPPRNGVNAQPAGFFQHRRSVSLSDLDGGGEPEVLVDLYWGGAHCCWYTQIYRYVPATGKYRTNVHVWGDFSYVLADLEHDGRQEIVTRDDRFSYAFASFADSRWPVRILRYRLGKMTVETTAYPSEIRRDATELWHEALARAPRKARNNQGIIAAWAADQAMLRRSRQAFATIDRLSRSGRIHGELPRAQFERRLRRFLVRTDYL
jgi:hypothetical protein